MILLHIVYLASPLDGTHHSLGLLIFSATASILGLPRLVLLNSHYTFKMHTSSLLLATLASVSAVMGSPAFPDLTRNNAVAGAVDTVSNYFNLLAEKVQATRQSAGATTCDLSKAVWPANGMFSCSLTCQTSCTQ